MSDPGVPGRGRRLLPVLFFLLGLFSLAAQTALIREYLVVCGGNELGIGFFFSSWLAWVAAGAALALLLLRRSRGAASRFPDLLALYPPALLLQLVLVRSLRSLAGVAPTDLFPAGSLFLGTFLTNAPVSLVTGFLFPLAAEALREEPGRAVSRVYVLESLGSFAGGAGITAFLLLGRGALPFLPPLSALLAAAGLAAAARSGSRVGRAAHSVVLTGSLLLCLPPVGGPVLRGLDRLQWRDLYPGAPLAARTETPYRRLSVARTARQTLLVANGQLLFSWPTGGAEITDAALLAVQPRTARRVLLLGLAGEPLAAELLHYPFREIVLLEPDGAGRDFLLSHLPPGARRALADPRISLQTGDPRAWLPRAAGAGRRFDLVVVDAGDPDTALAARLFTREFYRQVRESLAPGGVLAVAVTSAETAHGTELARYGASVLATLREVFPETAVTPGERAWFLASPEAGRVSADAGELEKRLRAMGPRRSRFEPERFSRVLEPGRVAFARRTFEEARERAEEEGEPLTSTDGRPLVYLLNLLVLGRMQGTGFSPLVTALGRAGIWILLLPLAVVLLFRVRHVLGRPDPAASARFAGGWLLVTFGAASIALNVLLLLAYQSRFGLLFTKVGLANALFMLGLFLGGAATRGRPGIGTGMGVVGAVFAFLLPEAVRVLPGETAFLALFPATGAVCGAAFPVAAALHARGGAPAGRTGAATEIADHLAGAVGAVLAGVLLLPLFGSAATARFLGVALLSAPLLAGLEGAVHRRVFDRLLPRATARMRSFPPSFPYVRTGFVLAAAAVAAVAVSGPVRRELRRPVVRISPERLASVVPADRYVEREEPFLHYDAWKKGEASPENHSLATLAVVRDVTGFGGPLNLLLSVDRDGRIRRVELLESRETPAYVEDLPALLEAFAGKDSGRDFRLVSRGEAADPHDIVKMTGATVTSRAVVETVNRAKNRVLADLLHRTPPAPRKRPGILERLGAPGRATLLLFVLAVPVFLRGGSRARTLFLVLAAAVSGFLYNQQFSAERVADLARLTLPPPGNLPGLVLVAGALLLSLGFGQVYCGLLCPFGAVQELAGKLGLRRRVSPDLDRRARFLKHGVLAVVVIAAALFGADRVLAFDPLGVAFSGKASPLMWGLIVLVLAASVFWFRFWCRYLCPVGAFFSLFNRIALLSRLARPKTYAHCDLGVRSRFDLDCLQCNRCLARKKEEDLGEG